MKYAFCVMAHSDIEELNRLVTTLREYGDIFLHIDKKMKDSTYMQRVDNLSQTTQTAEAKCI